MMKLKNCVYLFLIPLFLFPFISLAANCNPNSSPKITVTTIARQQPNPTPQFFKSEILNKNRITQTADVYGGAIVRVTVEDPTGNSCELKGLGQSITGCKMTMSELKAGKVVATSTTYFRQPSSRQYVFTPKDLVSNIVLNFSCGTASGKYSIGSAICERPFDQIVGDLEAQKPTIITENSFSDWAKDDKFDSCGFGLFGLLKCNSKYSYPNPPYTSNPVKSANSGDRQDWIRKLNINQELISSCVHSDFSLEGLTNDGQLTSEGNFLIQENLRFWLGKNKFPLLVGMRFSKKASDGGGNKVYPTLHGSIAVSYEEVPFNINFRPVNTFILKLIDTEWTGPREMVCFQSDQFLSAEQIKNWPGKFVCRYYLEETSGNFSGDYYGEIDRLYVSFPLATQCPLGDKDSSLCKRYSDLAGWLRNNFPTNLLNENSVGGYCGSWSVLFLRVAYFGEFGYECPRPGSGSASTLKSLQLANIQESINQIIEQIRGLSK